jgi:hypothetical protein
MTIDHELSMRVHMGQRLFGLTALKGAPQELRGVFAGMILRAGKVARPAEPREALERFGNSIAGIAVHDDGVFTPSQAVNLQKQCPDITI